MISDVFGAQDNPLVAGALRGYRSWSAVTSDGRLRSTGICYDWRVDSHTRPVQAMCLGGRCERALDSPGKACRCGLYGWYDPDDQRLVPGALFGAVEASGRLQLGAHGFRAERARVLGVWTPLPLFAGILEQTGHRVFESRSDLLDALPPDDVSGIVEHRCAGSDCARTATERQPSSLRSAAVTAADITSSVLDLAAVAFSDWRHRRRTLR